MLNDTILKAFAS